MRAQTTITAQKLAIFECGRISVVQYYKRSIVNRTKSMNVVKYFNYNT